MMEYIPADYNQLDGLLRENGSELNNTNLHRIIHINFCKHEFKSGKFIGKICYRRSKLKNGYCRKHLPHNLIYLEYVCGFPNTKNGNCNKHVKNIGNLCYIHWNYICKKPLPIPDNEELHLLNIIDDTHFHTDININYLKDPQTYENTKGKSKYDESAQLETKEINEIPLKQEVHNFNIDKMEQKMTILSNEEHNRQSLGNYCIDNDIENEIIELYNYNYVMTANQEITDFVYDLLYVVNVKKTNYVLQFKILKIIKKYIKIFSIKLTNEWLDFITIIDNRDDEECHSDYSNMTYIFNKKYSSCKYCKKKNILDKSKFCNRCKIKLRCNYENCINLKLKGKVYCQPHLFCE